MQKQKARVCDSLRSPHQGKVEIKYPTVIFSHHKFHASSVGGILYGKGNWGVSSPGVKISGFPTSANPMLIAHTHVTGLDYKTKTSEHVYCNDGTEL